MKTVPYEWSTDRGFYGGTYVGLLGGAITSTDQALIPQFDLNANDRFSPQAYPTALLYNGGVDGDTHVALNTSTARRQLGESATVDLFETTTDVIVARGVSLASGAAVPRVRVPAAQAVILVAIPAGSKLVRSPDGGVRAGHGGVVVRFPTPQ